MATNRNHGYVRHLQRTMRCFLFLLMCAAGAESVAAPDAVTPRMLIHGFQATGPAEITGTLPANRVLRTMQQYAVPAWSDLLATHVAHTLQDDSDAAVGVVRKPRQSGFEAARIVANAPADGQTLLLATRLPPLSSGLRLEPVAMVASMPYALVVRAGGSPQRVSDLIERARSRNERLLIATTSAETIGFGALEVLRRQAPAIQPVAYNGGQSVLQATVASHVAAGLVPLPSVLPYAGGGRLEVIAIADAHRHPGIPDVPTTAEAGVAELQAIAWIGVFAPGGTPAATVRRFAVLLARGPGSEQTTGVFSGLGVRLEHRDAGELTKLIAGDSRAPSRPL
jgi:tripartite-type tricarboxylate transporter receptor subunit TctC